jgi:hypothetical protein
MVAGRSTDASNMVVNFNVRGMRENLALDERGVNGCDEEFRGRRDNEGT